MIQALVFDLDDTLYPESEFVASGYRAVARHVARQYGCCDRDVFRAMMSAFATYGRECVLPTLNRQFLAEKVELSELVEVYRAHTPQIGLFAGYGDLLSNLRESYRLGIITDGLPEVQKRKVQALKLGDKVDHIVYTWEHGKEMQKPHPHSFLYMMGLLGSEPSTSLFIGDNLEKDLQGAHGAGMKYVQVQACGKKGRTSGRVNADEAEYVVESLHQLPRILRDM